MRLPYVGGEALAQAGLAAEFHQFARHVGTRHRDHFDRQREFAEHPDQLAFVGDAMITACCRRRRFFARQRAAAALDHGEMLGDFVGAVDVDFEFADAVEVEHLDAVAFQRAAVASELATAPSMRPLTAASAR